MKDRKLPSEYAVPAEFYVPPEIAKPAPEFVKPAPECPEAAAEMRNAPPEFTASTAAKPAEDAEEKKRRRNNRLRNLIQNTVAPVAATIAVVAVVFASFNFDPLGNDFLRAGSRQRSQEPEPSGYVQPTGPGEDPTATPTPTTAATPTPTPAYVMAPEGSISGAETKVLTMYHVEGANDETFETSLTDGDPMPEVRAWLKTWGGSKQLMEQNRNRVFLGYEYSDDAIVVGDPDDMANVYIAQGTVYAVYREDVYYYAFLDSHGPGYFEEVEGEEFPSMANLAPDFSGAFAWSGMYTEEYVRITVGGELHYLVAGSYWASQEGATLTDVPGVTYDRATNTLTLDNCNIDKIDTNLMGNGFTIKVIGENQVGRITLWGAGHSGSATITGDGELYVNESETADTGLMIYGETGPAALMVDRDVYVEIYGTEAAIMVSMTTMEKAIYTRGRMVTGGIRGNGDFMLYNFQVQDADGNYVVTQGTVTEFSQAQGAQFYDYTVITPEGEPGTRVQFIP